MGDSDDRKKRLEKLPPEEKMYSVTHIDFWKPPFSSEREVKMREKESLDDVTDFAYSEREVIAYDRYGRVYEVPEDECDTPVYLRTQSGVDTPQPPSEPDYPEKIRSPEEAISILEDKERELLERRNAIEKLRDIADEDPEKVSDHAHVVASNLADEDEHIREEACIFLGKVGSTEAISKMEELQRNDNSEKVREAAKEAIASARQTGE
jgi:hypothetical protein